MLGNMRDQGLEDQRVPENGEDIEEDDPLFTLWVRTSTNGMFSCQTFLGKSGCWVKRLRMRSTSAMAKGKEIKLLSAFDIATK